MINGVCMLLLCPGGSRHLKPKSIHRGDAESAHVPKIQSLCKSLREKVRAQPPQNHHELLLPIHPPPMGKTTRRELSPVEKGMVIAFFWFFCKISILSLIPGRPWSTVKGFLQRATERGHIENLPGSGRPEKLTKCERWHIWRTIKRDRKLTREQLRDEPECAPDVSLATIDRYLQENWMMKWLAK